MSGILYIVGTPIGNLSDISRRALDTLASADFIAAEDTRVSMKLLSRYDISKPMVSCHEHNIRKTAPQIVRRLEAGESCALITDAGMPCLSDPGAPLIELCFQSGIPVTVVPGPSAATAALALSGYSGKRFCFEGFLPREKAVLKKHIGKLKDEERLMIFYEAPHRIAVTLRTLAEALGEDRELFIGRELTKMHEEALHTTLGEAAALYETNEPRGEFVLVVKGNEKAGKEEISGEEAAKLAESLMEDGLSPSAAAREAAQRTGCRRSEIYRLICKEEDADV